MPRKLEYCFYPPPPKSARQTGNLPRDFAIAMGAPVASLVKNRDGQNGNSGAHAEEMARRLGTTVVAYQDLGPSVSFPELREARFAMKPENFPEYAGETAAALATALAGCDIGRVAFRVHSGNGPLGTELALNFNSRPQDIAPTHLAISDPAGLIAVPSFLAGLRRWLNYKVGPERTMPSDQRFEPEQPPSTLRSFASDIVVRGGLWRTPVTLENISRIRQEMTETAVLLHVPGNTFNGAPYEMDELAASIRVPTRDQGKPFMVEFAPDTYHGTHYDSFAGNATFMNRAISLAPLEG